MKCLIRIDVGGRKGCAQNRGSRFSHRAGACHEIAAPGFEPAIRAEDKNGDDRLCIKIIPNEGGPPQFDPAFVYVDNKI